MGFRIQLPGGTNVDMVAVVFRGLITEVMVYKGRKSGHGKSRCNTKEINTYDPRVGLDIALKRAEKNLSL